MARVRSPEKRVAILEAAVRAIAADGLGASTAKMARLAGVAEGTIFTYFASKEELLNEVYAELKSEGYALVNAEFPHKASLKQRAWHVWSCYLHWSIRFPERRKVAVQLGVSDAISAATRERSMKERGAVEATLMELEARPGLREMPPGFATATMIALQDAAMEYVGKHPKQQEELIARTFEMFWSAVQ